MIDDEKAASDHVEKLNYDGLSRNAGYLYHGHKVRDAFLAGIQHERAKMQEKIWGTNGQRDC